MTPPPPDGSRSRATRFGPLLPTGTLAGFIVAALAICRTARSSPTRTRRRWCATRWKWSSG
ncbi:hypothetical protein [Myxococcus sp. AB025B]|uniref:hypothetical protein n=1 Tax=Myxococcus TaxID=32 RepID=UPI001E447350|nr:hypothetical protein [Myxococcus sp. AB025B]